ncbi:MAG: TonB family protein [Chitinispirillaceae bacterium]|jgi:TonB family protein|nr:TonB family protein [Chitinispirillaceae bacterium]
MSDSSRSTGALSMNAMIREVRGPYFRTLDSRFLWLVLLSLALHIGVIVYFNTVRKPPKPTMDIEKIPERFAKLILEKPIPKTPLVSKVKKPALPDESVPAPEIKPDNASKFTSVQRKQAQQAVAARAARVEEKVRSVGVLGMLTGVGSTSKGPSVVDVLGAMKDHRETDLEEALAKMSGLQQAGNVEVLQRKLVRSKDLAIEHTQDIDDLVASVGSARSIDLAKRGEFVIQKPESIEGAASSNAKRDNRAIGSVVSSHKASIRMSYEKFLKRNPGLSGKVTVRFTIAASGSVSSVVILENTTGSNDLEQEIIRKVRLWQFEAISAGDATVTYPFVFMPSS